MNDISNYLESAIKDLKSIFETTDEVLNEWSGDKCLQFPALLDMMKVKMNWDDKQAREYDPFVRYYVRHHSDWHVTRGAHGGIMKAENKHKKDAERIAKAIAKAEIKNSIESKKSSSIMNNDSDIDIDIDVDDSLDC